jgi:hypothetical protein
VTFAPTAIGSFVDHLIIDSTGGVVDVQLSASAAPPGKLTIEPLTLDFGKVAVGDAKSASFKITNSGGSAITINKSKPPALGPFIATTVLDEGTLIAAGASLVQTVVFKPSAVGAASDGWVLTASDGSGQQTVGFGGEGVAGGGLKGDYYAGAELAQFQLSRTDSTVDFDWSATTPDPLLAPGQPYSVRWSGQLTPKFSELYTLSFVSQGGARVWVDGAIVIDQWTEHDLQEDAADVSLTAGRASTILIEYFNSGSGGARASLRWASPSQPAEVVPADALRFGAPDPIAGGWTLNGSASLAGATLQLTPATSGAHGSAFWPRPLPSSSIRASFDLAIDSGSGADGLTLAFADALQATPTALGNGGGGLAFSGIAGIAIAFDTHQNAGDPSHNFVGISDGPAAHADQLHWLAAATDIPPLRGVTRHVEINARDGRLAVAIDGKAALELPVQLPPQVFVGFTAANGGLTDRHAVANVLIR